MTRKSATDISILAALLGIFAGGSLSFSRPLIEIFLYAAISGIMLFIACYVVLTFIYSSDFKKEENKENDEIRIMQNELKRLQEIKQQAVLKRTGRAIETKAKTGAGVKGTRIDIKAGSDEDLRSDITGRVDN